MSLSHTLSMIGLIGSFSLTDSNTRGPFTRTVSVTFTVKFTMTDKMGSEPILSVKQSVTIDTMINFDGDGDGRGYVRWYGKRALMLSLRHGPTQCIHIISSKICVNINIQFH